MCLSGASADTDVSRVRIENIDRTPHHQVPASMT